MDQNRSIVVSPTDYSPGHFQAMREMAQTFIKSGAMPEHVKTPEIAIVIMQAGTELGITPMQAIRTLYPVKGQIAMQWNIMSSRLRKGGCQIRITEETNEKCSMHFKRTDTGEEHDETFTFEEAESRGFTKKRDGTMKQNWKNMRKEMLRARCGSRGARFIAPDLIEGIYAVEEMADVEKGAHYNNDGTIEVVVENPETERILDQIRKCPDRRSYMADILPKIKETKGLSYDDRAAITKAAEAKLEEFAQAESANKASKDKTATKEALKKAAEAPESDEGEEEVENSENSIIDAEVVEKGQDGHETTEDEMKLMVKKIRNFTKQSQVIDYIQGTVNAMPMSKEQRKEVRGWVSNKIAQLNGKIPDEDDLKMIFAE